MTTYGVKCGCGRDMTADGRAGRHAFRCGCGVRIQVADPQAPVRRCSYGNCRTVAVTKEPLRFCLDHEKAAASQLGPLAGALEVERFLNSSASARYRRFGPSLAASKQAGKHPPVVYFMKRERLIKIGTSTNLKPRAVALGALVMATTPGGRTVEGEHHKRFAHLHVFGEWFEPGPDLLEYIDALRKRHGRAILF